jgi:hypothetical protein
MLNIADAHNSLALLQLLVCEINSNVTMKSCRERETRTFRDRFPGTYGIYTFCWGYICVVVPFYLAEREKLPPTPTLVGAMIPSH